MLTLFHASCSEDVHYPTWEMHPHGDELLILLSGSLSVEFRDSGRVEASLLQPQAAFIVPSGDWHRLIVHESSTLIAITLGHQTVHEAD
ncbi:cupin domain-containing protein [Dyella mobilis]|uniref:Cupin domain-containing protein n=1 Tax=Dyella mobilis TaxID=1849582 RepID=A0ABS2KD10_9GAMM|nr:cupin domain-containing protein [Dyella mobilis]MBM7129047.1 cupin domain-containing protein [Dyella mobilis]GLQ99253.1 hypothetical protein GCM10007863_36730 [Dyella mobilis]